MPLMNTDNHSSQRNDIQVLRGIAVLLVMLYHVEFPLLANGYLGVDIFFVLSGFLITRIILNDLDKERFSFKAFYVRRARRLLPAAYAVLFVTALMSSVFLSTPRLVSLFFQLAGSLTFTANIVLWMNTNYFTGASDLLPLLHVWSLSLEEQFYFVLPLILFFAPSKIRPLIILALLAGSFIACCYLLTVDSSMTFFMLPTRAWELLFGSILATSLLPDFSAAKYKEVVAGFAMVVIAYIVTQGIDIEHPRFDALVVCVCTVMLIGLRASFLNQGIHVRLLAKIGDLSYSLYLVHWPLIAIAKNVWIDNAVPASVCAILFFVSFPLALLLYHFVEQPFRQGNRFGTFQLRYLVIFAPMAIFAPVIIALILAFQTTGQDWNFIRRVNFGLSPECEYTGQFEWRTACETSGKPEPGKTDVLVWGDSYAMHLMPGLVEKYPGHRFIQATRSSCAPNLYMAQVSDAYNADWARSCLDFNASVLEYIKTQHIEHVILAARFNQFEDAVLHNDIVNKASFEQVSTTFIHTIDSIRQSGAAVLIFSPPPVDGADIGECLEKDATGKFYITERLHPGCRVSKSAYLQHQSFVIRLVEEIRKSDLAAIELPANILCGKTYCEVVIDGVPLYRDYGHYTVKGSELLMQKMDIFKGDVITVMPDDN